MAKEFKVICTPERWEVHFDDQKIGYPAWDKSVALSYAKDMAKKNRPSTIIIHNRNGKAEKQIDYPDKGSAVEKKLV